LHARRKAGQHSMRVHIFESLGVADHPPPPASPEQKWRNSN
jgi:hypothetical protein